MNSSVYAMVLLTAAAAVDVASAEGWIGCANRTHSIDVLVDTEQQQVLGFGLTIHGARQDAISWDIIEGQVTSSTQTMDLRARERSTAPREFTLRIRGSSAELSFRAAGPEPAVALLCFWGAIGN